MYQDGDFLVRAPGCEKDESRNCETELADWYQKWKSTYGMKSVG